MAKILSTAQKKTIYDVIPASYTIETVVFNTSKIYTNQLANNHIGDLLHQLKILYAPDYVINSGGLISVVEELERELPREKFILKRVKHISKILQEIFKKSKKLDKPTHAIANQMAEKIFNNHR